MTDTVILQTIYLVGCVLLVGVPQISSNAPCRFNEFRCADGSGCLSTEKLCNGRKDCKNGEEERGMWCQETLLSKECKDDEFRCRFGGCIPVHKKCDSYFDCYGGTDEATDLCGSKPKPPPKAPPHYITTEKVQQRPRPTNPPQYPSKATIPPPALLAVQSSSSTSRGNKCPVLQLEQGQIASCYKPGLSSDIYCLEEGAPLGTVADISCDDFYKSSGIQKTRKTCENGQWKGGTKRFFCELECGKGGYKPVGLVAGGRTSVKGKWPWHVGLYEADIEIRKFKNICGATLISKRAVVTAAHCVTTPNSNRVKDVRRLKIFLGKFHRDVDRNDEDVQLMKAVRIVVHERYSYQNLDADIAVIFLDKDAEITPIVRPICLPDPSAGDDEVPVNYSGMLVGWGSTGNRVYPDLLQETSLPVVSHQKCRASHQALAVLAKADTFCAGYANGTSACDGDSGSGLVFPHSTIKDKWTILGIVSGGVPLAGAAGCDPFYYVAFTNVAKYRNWLDDTLEQYTPYDN